MKYFSLTALLFSCALSSCSPESSATSGDDESISNRNALDASVAFGDNDCAAQGLPVAIHITNNGERPTRTVEWSFSAFQPGHSTDLAGGDWMLSSGDPNRSTDRIIQPGETFKACSSAPRLQGGVAADELDYGVKLTATY